MIAMMIYRVEIENFYSIRERQVIDLVVEGEAPNDLKRVVNVGGNADTWVPRVVAVFGPNASGKTNVLRAISFAGFFATASAFSPAHSGIMSYFKFKTSEMEKSPTRISVSFASNYDFLSNENCTFSENHMPFKYIYKFELSGTDENNMEKVTSESLHCLPSNTDKKICVFERDENGKVKIYDKVSSHEKLETLEDVLRKDASVISTLSILNDQFGLGFSAVMRSICTNIVIVRRDHLDKYIKEYFDNKELLESLNSELGRFDFGVSGVKVFEKKDGPAVWFEHDGLESGVIQALESHGTQRFIAIYPILRDALKTGGVAVIDEFDISLHPMMLPEIVGWFEDPEKNPHKAQLWITCHSVTLMKHLVKEGIVICDKNRRGASSVYSLGSVEGVRSNEDFMDGYLLGVFGGTPVIG